MSKSGVPKNDQARISPSVAYQCTHSDSGNSTVHRLKYCKTSNVSEHLILTSLSNLKELLTLKLLLGNRYVHVQSFAGFETEFVRISPR